MDKLNAVTVILLTLLPQAGSWNPDRGAISLSLLKVTMATFEHIKSDEMAGGVSINDVRVLMSSFNLLYDTA